MPGSYISKSAQSALLVVIILCGLLVAGILYYLPSDTSAGQEWLRRISENLADLEPSESSIDPVDADPAEQVEEEVYTGATEINAFVAAGDLDAALTRALELDRLHPDNFYALNMLGWVYGWHEDFDTGRAHLQRSIELEPEYAPSHRNLCYNYISSGELALAEVSCQRALSLDPYDPGTYHYLAMIDDQHGNCPAVITHEKQAVDIHTTQRTIDGPVLGTIYRNLARCLISEGQRGDALYYVRLLRTLEPSAQDAIELERRLMNNQ